MGNKVNREEIWRKSRPFGNGFIMDLKFLDFHVIYRFTSVLLSKIETLIVRIKKVVQTDFITGTMERMLNVKS